MTHIPITTPDGRHISSINKIPAGYTVSPTGTADDISNGSYGGGVALKTDGTDANSKIVDFQVLDHYYALGGRAYWEGADMDDCVHATLMAPASSGLTEQAGDYDKVEVVPSSGLHVIVPNPTPGNGQWDMDLSATLNANVSILAATPVPQAGNTGWFDYDSDTNVLSVNSSQEGGYNLYDFDVSLFKFAQDVWGQKGDGTALFESSDVLGKLLYNSWVIRFQLFTSKGASCRCGFVINAARKRNV